MATRNSIAPGPPPRESPPSRSTRRWTLALLAATILLAFSGVLHNGWVLLDDPEYVYGNVHVTGGLTLDGLRWFLHEPHSENWHPLTSVSHMLDVQLFGLAPAGHHAVSLLLHTLNALLLASVLYGLTRSWWRSLIVAGLFALHPLRVESVAWISERKDVLSLCFFLLTIAAYRRWTERPGPARYALVMAGFALGLLSKPMVVTLPCVLILLDLWPLRRLVGSGRERVSGAPARSIGGVISEKWPLFVLAAVSASVTYVVQSRAGAVQSMMSVTFAQRLSNALITYWRYIGSTLWPHGLAVFYPYTRGPMFLPALVAAVAMLVVTLWVVRQRARRPYLLLGWLWYIGTLVPVIGLIQVGGQAHADRYTYIPAIGLMIALVWSVSDLVAASRPARVVTGAAAALLMAGLSVASARQVAQWKDSRTLFTHAMAVTRDNPIAEQGLGNALLQSGDAEAAVGHLKEALRLAPDLPDLQGNLGSALGTLGRYGEAAACFRAALRVRETAANHHNLGSALTGLGRLDEAISEYEAAIRLDPGYREPLAQLAMVYARLGRFGDAVRTGERALALAVDAHDRPAAALAARRLEAYRAGRSF